MHTGKITVDGEDWDLNALLDELDSEPMVFGTGNFAINERFHFGVSRVLYLILYECLFYFVFNAYLYSKDYWPGWILIRIIG